jgi:FtsP/CotA-like multicopper oxidase with cupredoxin domain
LIGILAVAFLFGAISMLIFKLQPVLTNSIASKTPNVYIVLYEGELPDGHFGFGTSPNNLSAPGPTIGFSTSDAVNITVVNVGKLPHAFAITTSPTKGASELFDADIGSATNPLEPGQKGSVVFVPNNAAFDYWYISPVGGDIAKGMYGAVIVSSVTGGAFP